MPKPRRRTRWRRASFSSGGTGPYTYALTAGTLPQGLSLSGSTISGTPQYQTIKTFTITSTDSLGNTGWQTYDLSIELGGGNAPLMLAAPMLLVGDTLKYAFTHDANGRMTAKGAQAYVYDALNRMTQVTSKESYLYDGHGRRVQVTKTSDGKLNYPIYSLDGKLLLEDNRQTLKRTEYIYAGGRLVAKRIQPITSAGANNGAATTTTIHTDFLGSPVAETNSAGTVTRVERYTPYGEPADMALDVGPGFTGHATDVLTGLTYMQQRYYHAEIGRTLTPDPVATDPNSGGNFNVYWYADNNPVANVDPDGMKACGKDTGCAIGSGQSPGTVGGSSVSATTAKRGAQKGDGSGNNVISSSATSNSQSEKAGMVKDNPSLIEVWLHYKLGSGEPMDFNQSKLTVMYVRKSDGTIDRAWVTGSDYAVHGHVSLNPATMRIYDGQYDFDQKPNDSAINMVRNFGTAYGKLLHGSGTPFLIKYHGGNPTVIEYKHTVVVPILPAH